MMLKNKVEKKNVAQLQIYHLILECRSRALRLRNNNTGGRLLVMSGIIYF